MTADSKESFLAVYKQFFNNEKSDKPIIFEVFTTTEDEDRALKLTRTIVPRVVPKKELAAKVVKKIIGEKNVEVVKAIKNSLNK